MDGPGLFLTAGASAGLAILRCRDRWWRLARRSRILIFSLILLYSFFTPGERLWPEPYWLSLTREGLFFGLMHACRLLGLISALALMLEHLSPDMLVSALTALLRPLRRLGLEPTHAAMRLVLVLRGLEQRPVHTGWRSWIEGGDDPGDFDAPVSLEFFPWRPLDRLGLLVMLGIAAALIGVQH